MAIGKTHDKINIFLGLGLTVFLFFNAHDFIPFSFLGGWLFSTFIFNPDTDFMPKKRTGILQYVLYPYSIFFKHRGISHSFLFGTLTRIFYSLFIILLLIFVFHKMNYLSYSHHNFFGAIKDFIKNYDYFEPSYLIATWIFIGLFLADLSHIFLDKVSSFLKKLF